MVNKGKEAFLNYYRQQFGDRAEGLLAALSRHVSPALLIRNDKFDYLKSEWQTQGYFWKDLDWFSGTVVAWPENVAFGAQLPGSREGWLYPMAASSLVPVAALNIQPENKVLDACAAPGGKAVACAGQLADPNSQMVVNDVSVDRVVRLRKVLRQFGYGEVEVRRGPAEYLSRWYPGYFDRVLVDAPCSSEAHVWKSREHLAQWTPKRVEKLKERQINIISETAATLKPGGKLVYATCALTPEENEAVVQEVLARQDLDLKLESGWGQDLPGGPGLIGYGFDPDLVRRIWPDEHNLDPMFAAVFKKSRQ